jgi:putative hydrolase of the HAD superfamily
MPSAKHLLLDYGQVICLPQSCADLDALAALAELPTARLMERYWLGREAYDRGGSARTYWTCILGAPPGDTQLGQLSAQDTAAWLRLDPVVIPLLNQLHRDGVPLSLLTNAPHELAQALRRHAVFGSFAHLLFSAELEMSKPDPRIYAAAIDRLDVPAVSIVFVDDRPENVEAAAAAGMVSIHYTGHHDLATIQAALRR